MKTSTNKFLLLFILLCFFYPAITFSQGTIKNDSLFSSSLGIYKKVTVYLPQGYDSLSTLRYRTIYLLHGAQGNQNYYSAFYTKFDTLIANNTIKPTIIVMPDASAQPYAGSFYTNSILYGNYENYIYIDVIGYIDTKYKTLASRNNRSIAGHSMGGFGAMNLAFKHSDLFRGTASISGPLDLNHFADLSFYLQLENGFAPPITYNPANGIVTLLSFSLAGALSPNLSAPPYYVDFILNSNAQVVDSVFTKWKTQNPARLSRNITAATNLALYFDCGLQDELTLSGWNTAFRDTLLLRGIPFQYTSYTGGHTNMLGSRIPFALNFLDSAMDFPTNIIQGSVTPDDYSLEQNYPNPFNPSTTINFSLPVNSFVNLKVFDMTGREVANLINQNLIAGAHEINFNAAHLTSGIYFYRLDTENFSETKKMMLVK